MRVQKRMAVICAVGAFSCAPALCATPQLSGLYSFEWHQDCAPVVTAEFDGSTGTNLLYGLSEDTVGEGIFAGTVSFDHKKGKMLFAGGVASGSPFLTTLTGKASGTYGTSWTETVGSTLPTKYSTTSKTVKLLGGTFHALYGGIDSNNVAHDVYFVGLEVECMNWGTLTKQ